MSNNDPIDLSRSDTETLNDSNNSTLNNVTDVIDLALSNTNSFNNDDNNTNLLATPTRSRRAPKQIKTLEQMLPDNVLAEYRRYQFEFDLLLDHGPSSCNSNFDEIFSSSQHPISNLLASETQFTKPSIDPKRDIFPLLLFNSTQVDKILKGTQPMRYTTIQPVTPWPCDETCFFNSHTHQIPTINHYIRSSYKTLQLLIIFKSLLALSINLQEENLQKIKKNGEKNDEKIQLDSNCQLSHVDIVVKMEHILKLLVLRLIQDEMASYHDVENVLFNIIFTWSFREILQSWQNGMETQSTDEMLNPPHDFIIARALNDGFIKSTSNAEMLYKLIKMAQCPVDLSTITPQTTANNLPINIQSINSSNQMNDGENDDESHLYEEDGITFVMELAQVKELLAKSVFFDDDQVNYPQYQFDFIDDEDEKEKLMQKMSMKINETTKYTLYLGEIDGISNKRSRRSNKNNDDFDENDSSLISANYYTFPIWEVPNQFYDEVFTVYEKAELKKGAALKGLFKGIMLSYISYFGALLDYSNNLDTASAKINLNTASAKIKDQKLKQVDHLRKLNEQNERLKKEAEREADNEAARVKKEAEKEAAKAKKEAERLKKEAEKETERLKKEAEKAKKEAEKEAEKVKKEAERLKKEAEKEAERLKKEAEKEAEKAKKEAEKDKKLSEKKPTVDKKLPAAKAVPTNSSLLAFFGPKKTTTTTTAAAATTTTTTTNNNDDSTPVVTMIDDDGEVNTTKNNNDLFNMDDDDIVITGMSSQQGNGGQNNKDLANKMTPKKKIQNMLKLSNVTKEPTFSLESKKFSIANSMIMGIRPGTPWLIEYPTARTTNTLPWYMIKRNTLHGFSPEVYSDKKNNVNSQENFLQNLQKATKNLQNGQNIAQNLREYLSAIECYPMNRNTKTFKLYQTLVSNPIITKHLAQFSPEVSEQVNQEFKHTGAIIEPQLSTTFLDYNRTKYAEIVKSRRKRRKLYCRNHIDMHNVSASKEPLGLQDQKKQNCLNYYYKRTLASSTKTTNITPTTSLNHNDMIDLISNSPKNARNSLFDEFDNPPMIGTTTLTNNNTTTTATNSTTTTTTTTTNTNNTDNESFDSNNPDHFSNPFIYRPVKCIKLYDDSNEARPAPVWVGPWPLYNPILPGSITAPVAFHVANPYQPASISNAIVKIYRRKPLLRYPNIHYHQPIATAPKSDEDDRNEEIEAYDEFETSAAIRQVQNQNGSGVGAVKDDNDEEDDEEDEELEYEDNQDLDIVEDGVEEDHTMASVTPIFYGPQLFKSSRWKSIQKNSNNNIIIDDNVEKEQHWNTNIPLASHEQTLFSHPTISTIPQNDGNSTILSNNNDNNNNNDNDNKNDDGDDDYFNTHIKRFRLNPPTTLVHNGNKNCGYDAQLPLLCQITTKACQSTTTIPSPQRPIQLDQPDSRDFVQLQSLRPVVWPVLINNNEIVEPKIGIYQQNGTIVPTVPRRRIPITATTTTTTTMATTSTVQTVENQTPVKSSNTTHNTEEVQDDGSVVHIVSVKRRVRPTPAQ